MVHLGSSWTSSLTKVAVEHYSFLGLSELVNFFQCTWKLVKRKMHTPLYFARLQRLRTINNIAVGYGVIMFTNIDDESSVDDSVFKVLDQFRRFK